jgi:ABC-type lipoprotein release transport system permease subunit
MLKRKLFLLITVLAFPVGCLLGALLNVLALMWLRRLMPALDIPELVLDLALSFSSITCGFLAANWASKISE